MMKLCWLSKDWLCTSKSYSSTFKIRSRLTQFFKHVHPDQLSQAPTKIKQQNLRSLTNFNSYIDSIAQAKPSQAKLLKFYIAEKTNLKSKKFFSFTVQLPEIKNTADGLNQEKTQKLVDNIVEVLNRKFVESKNFKTKHGKINQQDQKIESIRIEEKETQDQKVQKMTSTIKPFNRNIHLKAEQAEILKNNLNAKYMQAEKQSLSAKLLSKITFANTGTNKPMMWSRLTAEQAGVYQDYQKIMDELIDPRLIYFDETLTSQQINRFKQALLPGELDLQKYKDSKIINEICAKMQSFEPPVCFYVSRKYSSTQIPGFLTIPYNFKATQLGQYFQKQISTVLQQQNKFQQYFDYYNDLKSSLQSQNKLYIDEVQFKNNQQIWGHILMLKRLQKYSCGDKKIGVIVFDKEKFEIFVSKYGLQKQKVGSVVLYKGKIISRVDFIEQDMSEIMRNINQSANTEKQHP